MKNKNCDLIFANDVSKKDIGFNSDFNEGDILEVIQGPFKDYNVEVMTIQGDKILGQIDMFGRTVPAEFTKSQLYKHDTATARS